MIGQKGIPTLYGGIERHVEELSTRLVKNTGNSVFVYTRPYYTPKDLKEYKNVKLISIPSIKTKHLDAISHTLFSTIHALFQDYDVIHFHGVGPSLLSFIPRIFKPKAKIISTFHCRDAVLSKWGKFAKLSLAIGEWTAINFVHQTITVSESLVDYIEKKYKKRVNYIPSGIAPIQVKKPNMIIKSFGLLGDDYIIAVARLIKDKGIHYLIEAYNNIETDKKLVIVGDTSFTDEYVLKLKDMAEGNENIIFTGWQQGDMLAELYSNAYVFVQPSISEGLSVSVLEAASYGLGIIASDIPANIEIINKHGFIFKNKNVKNLENKLKLALINPEQIKDAGQKVRGYVIEKYDWNLIAYSTTLLYKEVKNELLVKVAAKQI